MADPERFRDLVARFTPRPGETLPAAPATCEFCGAPLAVELRGGRFVMCACRQPAPVTPKPPPLPVRPKRPRDPLDVDDGDYIAERYERRDDTPDLFPGK